MRSPLANLKGLVEILRDDPSDKKAIKYIQFELERLDKVIIEMAEDASGEGATQIVVKKTNFSVAIYRTSLIAGCIMIDCIKSIQLLFVTIRKSKI